MSKLAMTEEIFWEYLSTEINSGAEEFDLISNLTEKLTKKSNEEIFSFGVIIDELMAKSYSSKLWCAAYLVNHGCTDDGFDSFRLWLISKGKETFYDVINNPDNLIKYVHLTDSVEDEKYGEFYENEDFLYIAIDAYAKKNEIESFEDLYEIYLDNFDKYKDEIKYEDSDYPHIKMTWNEEKPETMRSLCPKLFEGFYLEVE